MVQPLDPTIQKKINLLLKAMNNLVAQKSRDQQLAGELEDLGIGVDIDFIEIPEVRIYDESDAEQLVREISNHVIRNFILTEEQLDYTFLYILDNLPQQLLPGVSPVERRVTGDQPISDFQINLDGAITLTATNIRRFPKNALEGMRQGAVALALLRNNRISQEGFNAYIAGGTTSDEVAIEMTAIHRAIRDNMADIINIATLEAKEADFTRAISSVISGETSDDLQAGISLFPIIPGYGVPELRDFTEKESDDLRNNFPTLLKDKLPTKNQLVGPYATAQQQTRLLFIDDVVSEASDILALPDVSDDDKLRQIQSILDGSLDRFEMVRQATVEKSADEAETLALTAKIGTPAQVKTALSNMPGMPTENQLETQEEKDALKKLLDDMVDEAEKAAKNLRDSPLGFTEQEILDAKQVVIDGAARRWTVAQLIARTLASAEQKRTEFIEQAAAAPTTVAQKNTILGAAFQTPEFHELLNSLGLPPIEFDKLTAATKKLARAEIAGMGKDEAEAYAANNAVRWAGLSIAETEAEAAAPAIGPTEHAKFIKDQFFQATGKDLGEASPELRDKLEDAAAGMSKTEVIAWLNAQEPWDYTGEIDPSRGLPYEGIPPMQRNNAQALWFQDVAALRTAEAAEAAEAEAAKARDFTTAAALAEAEGLEAVEGNLTAFGRSIATEAGLIGPTTSPEFLEHFTSYTLPRIANAAALSGFTTTEEIEQFFRDEFQLNLVPGEIAPGRSTTGLNPADVFESDFTRQYTPLPPEYTGLALPTEVGGPETALPDRYIAHGGPIGVGGPETALPDRYADLALPTGAEGPPSVPLRASREEPFPAVEDSPFISMIREAAGDDYRLFTYLLGKIPEMQRGFRKTRIQPVPQGILEGTAAEEAYTDEEGVFHEAVAATPGVIGLAKGFAAPYDKRIAAMKARLAEAERRDRYGFEELRREEIAEINRQIAEQERLRPKIQPTYEALREMYRPAPLTEQGYFRGAIGGLMEGFGGTPGGFASALEARRRKESEQIARQTEIEEAAELATQEAELATQEAELEVVEAERERRQRLRGRGRTVLRV